MRGWARRWLVGLLAAVLVGVAGCGLGPSAASDPPVAQSLGDADVAVYITQFTNDGTRDGRVVLFDRSGPVSMVPNSGIMVPGLVWDRTGLFFVDQTTDYQVSDRVERPTRSRTADTLVGMQAGQNGRRVVLFNDGLNHGKNHTGIGLYQGIHELSQTTVLDTMANSLASCTDGQYLVGAKTVDGDWSSLIRVDQSVEDPADIGGVRPGVVFSSHSAPCTNGSIVALRYPDSDAGSYHLELWQWHTADGSVRRVKLRTGSSQFVAQRDMIFDGMPSWLDGGDLVWLDGTGVVWRSNLKTGLTRRVRDGLPVTYGPINAWAKTDQWLVGFTYSADHTTAQLSIYSTKDLSLIETRQLPGLNNITPTGSMVLAIAINPNFTPSK